jgi:hypothetical protein
MAKVCDVVVTQRYERNGEEKKRYINIGSVFDGEKGMSVKLDTIPLGWDGWAQFYEPKPREEAPPASKTARASLHPDDPSDQIPF